MKKITLDCLDIGKTARVISVNNDETIKRRFYDIGIVSDALVTNLFESPFKDPIAYKIKNAIIAIRKKDSKKIVVEEL